VLSRTHLSFLKPSIFASLARSRKSCSAADECLVRAKKLAFYLAQH
jgi:hypothetical protein